MSAPNRNVLWARAVVDELVAGGVSSVCVSPGSRSTPLTVAAAEHDDLELFSLLDERSAAYFALGRGRRTGAVTPLICTSGTAAANYHPAVIEASQARVPLLALTADRPPALRDSGANQTVDQEKLYGDAVRYYKDLPEPAADGRKLRSVRTTVARALAAAEGTPAGPVHLNVPFRKPLEPVTVPDDVPGDLDPAAAEGRKGDAWVSRRAGAPQLDDRDLGPLARGLSTDRGLIVAGPADPPGLDPEAVTALAHATGFPVLADPLSGLRFGGHVRAATVCGGYDGYLATDAADDWPEPEVVVRLGASPTSKALRKYLAGTGADQYVVDPAGEWREAEFAATDLVVADPSRLAGRLARLVDGGDGGWRERWERAEARHWEVVADAVADGAHLEGRVLADVFEAAPDPATVVVSNSTPVRDADRFGEPATESLTVLGNRGASGIDGVVSTALGAGSATTDDLTLVIGDLALYHDTNGLLAVERCDVDATVVCIDNDGGGIFHMLPIESFDPPFTEQFRTPHGLEFDHAAAQFGLDHERVGLDEFRETYRERVREPGSDLIVVETDGERAHRARESLVERLDDALGAS